MGYATVDYDNPRVFSALEFLGVFFSSLKKQNVNVVSAPEFYKTIGKNREKYKSLFVDIDIVDNGGIICSNDLEEGISMLQILGIVGKANPKYERIILKMHKDAADEFINDCPKSQANAIVDFTNDFLRETNGECE